MTFQRSLGMQELLALRVRFNSLVDALDDARIDLPSANEPSAHFVSHRLEIPKLVALCDQVSALLGGPNYTLNQAFLFHIPSCLRVAIDAHVEETLREAEEQGKTALHVRSIAKSSAVCPEKLARILRLLAARHIFREVGLDTFARNRCSSALDTGKSVRDLEQHPELTYDDSAALTALLAHTADECFKAAAYLPETVLSPRTAFSYEIRDAPFGMAYGDNRTLYEHYAKKRNAAQLARFSNAIKSAGKSFGGGEDKSMCGYPWQSLPKDAVVVDVGAGVGHVALTVSEKVRHARVVVQDLEDVIKEARSYWRSSAPRELESGRVTLMAYDFFTEQPVKRAHVYVLRAVVHDWADNEAVRILNRIADAAAEHSSLVLIEHHIAYLCHPNPFPPRSLMPYFIDLQMMVAMNSLIRTQPQHEALAAQAGWKLKRVWKTGEDGQEGPYRHYEFVLTSERVKMNQARDSKGSERSPGRRLRMVDLRPFETAEE
ncbi:uncharacterized protein JCM15063_005070 [Sporobolomyces koalae]|uniref:uncharacterized protein n=1 Tax=Sporobolomyces koalae TaxID=500713 RepID=UPI00317CD765